MPQTWPFKWFRRLFQKGVNRDIDPNDVQDGYAYDAQNARPSGVLGHTGALRTIGGEILLYGADTQGVSIPGNTTYRNVGSCLIQSHRFEIWASTQPDLYFPIIRIDGTVMANSEFIPYTWDHPINVRPVEQSGLAYTADGNTDLLYWDVNDMILNLNTNTGKYFAGFQLVLQNVGLIAAPLIVVLNREQPLIDLGTNGAPVGQYKIEARWRDGTGNVTNVGPPTPLFNIPEQYALPAQTNYPGGQTIGGLPNPLIGSKYGLNLDLRADNQAGFAGIDIIVTRFNDGAGASGAGVIELVARIPVNAGITDINFVYPRDNNVLEVLTVLDEQESTVPLNPWAVEFADHRIEVANFDIASRKPNASFLEMDGQKLFPITKRLTSVVNGVEVNDGYANTWHAGYEKKYVGGEEHEWCVQYWNQYQGKFYAQKIDRITLPNRRDIKGPLGIWGQKSLTYSTDPNYEANVDCYGAHPVTETFECYEQGTSSKTDWNSIVNLSVPGVNIFRPLDQFNIMDPNPPLNTDYTLSGTPVKLFPAGPRSYDPWRPNSTTDTNPSGYNISPVAQFYVFPNNTAYNPLGNKSLAGSGQIFNQRYHSLGVCIPGIINIPDNVTAIGIGVSKPAGKVICSGIGFYALSESGDGSPATKSTNAVWFHSPDLANGNVDQATLEDIQANPNNYDIVPVSPLGLFCEPYGNGVHSRAPWGTFAAVPSSETTDMMLYARVMEDHGQVNPFESPIHAFQVAAGDPAPQGSYTGGSKWRNDATGSYNWFQDGSNNGNTPMQISAFSPVTDNRSSYWRIQTNNYIYAPEGNHVDWDSASPAGNAFGADQTRLFHQPTYIFDIVRRNAELPNLNQTSYRPTGCVFPKEGCIGIGNGAIQTIKLIAERWEDCVPYLPTDFRYTYIKGADGSVEIWTCITNNDFLQDPANLSVVLNDIANGGWANPFDGVIVKGLYTAVLSNNTWSLQFGVSGFQPAVGTRILVRYDNRTTFFAPIRCFGGDATIAPSVCAFLDRVGDSDTTDLGSPDTQFKIRGLPLPYPGWVTNPRWFMPWSGTETQKDIFVPYQYTLRQLVVMYDAESRTQPAMSVNLNGFGSGVTGTSNSGSQFDPNKKYVGRPFHNINFAVSAAANGFAPQYDSDYPNEVVLWAAGGTRFQPDTNGDYIKQLDPAFFTFPIVGIKERTRYGNAVLASNQLNPNLQDLPSLRTFTFENLKLTSEENGDITQIAAALANDASNMYGWAVNGVFRILMNKNVLTTATADTIVSQSIDKFWGQENWLTRGIGLPYALDKSWCPIFIPGHNLVDGFMWGDRKGIYEMRGDTIGDVSRNKYQSKLLPYLTAAQARWLTTAYYDRKNNEYGLSMNASGSESRIVKEVSVYSPQRQDWNGYYTYSFDGYLCDETIVLGMRQLQTYTLDSGETISGDTIIAWGEGLMVPEPGMYMEAMRFRVDGDKPWGIELRDSQYNLMVQQNEDQDGPSWSKNYDGWENWISRTITSYSATNRLAQDYVFFLRVIYKASNQTMKSVSIQTKKIK